MENIVIVGVGEVVEQVPESLETASSPLDLMVAASKKALQNAHSAGITDELDTVAVVRTTSDSGGMLKSPFGDPENYPRSIAQQLGFSPKTAVYSPASGQSPQVLVNTYSTKISTGECEAVMIVAAEAVANQKALKRAKVKTNWRNDVSGQLENLGPDGFVTLDVSQLFNELTNIPAMYSLFENARRAKLKASRADYAAMCGEMFSRFSGVAESHPQAMFPKRFSANEITEISETNTAITDIYTRAMVAKDGVNLGSAIVMMSESKAIALGIDPAKFIYPLAGSEATDKTIPYREDLSTSIAQKAAYDAVFDEADLTVSDITRMDLYSCFPIAVFSACEALAISPNDPRGLTVTGGLPFFGGPGNSYSLHGIVNIVSALRKDGKGIGLVGANGGFLSKHAIGLYGTSAPKMGWREADKAALQLKVASQKTPEIANFAEGRAVVETFSVEFNRKGPKRGFIIGRLEDGRRFLGCTDRDDEETVQDLLTTDPIGREVFVTGKGPGNRFTFDPQKTRSLIPSTSSSLDGDFKYCLVKRDGNILEVTINRPDARNSLTPEANFELERVFDLYEKDQSLWCAILTGAGDKSFCAGNDLKYTITGKPLWVPETGFAGLTHRKKRLKPVIAAVNGYAFGGGLEIALACDIIVADETAKFALPEVKTGLIAAAGGLFRLPKILPPHIAKDMILTGRAMEVDEALHYGLVNYKADAAGAMEKAREFAQRICAVSPTAVSASLEMIHEGAKILDPTDALDRPSNALLKFASSQDLQIGLMAFMSKQKPKWKNR